MRNWLLLVGLCAVLGLSVGCAGVYGAPVIPSSGLLFARIDAPLSLNYDQTPITNKRGEAASESILGLIAIGDASIQKAADNGGITKVHYADYRFENILGIYSKFTTVAYGQ